MKLLFVRHAEPDYEHDSLTEKGWREAAYLAERLAKLDIQAFYVSPLGRAKDTASLTLQAMRRTATTCDWLREFHAPIRKPDCAGLSIPWDWLPQDWCAEERYFHYDHWTEPEIMRESNVAHEYQRVTENLDELLKHHGYARQGHFYHAERPNVDTIVFFCHFGVQCVILSHVLNISPMSVWHGFCAAPSSVTTLITEERREGIAVFRMSAFGDISHLYAHQEPPSFSARFREMYANDHERRD